jgi:YesN/AraC family two-component response regulator
MKLRVLIADDELLSRMRIRQMLAEAADVEIVGEAEDGDAALRLIAEQHPDLVFLDIQMPERSGLKVANELPEPGHPAIIFVTAHSQHVSDTCEFGAVDYLLKPFKAARFQEALERARDHCRSRHRKDPCPALGSGANSRSAGNAELFLSLGLSMESEGIHTLTGYLNEHFQSAELVSISVATRTLQLQAVYRVALRLDLSALDATRGLLSLSGVRGAHLNPRPTGWVTDPPQQQPGTRQDLS